MSKDNMLSADSRITEGVGWQQELLILFGTVFTNLKAFSKHYRTDLVWHYTSAKGLISILDNKSLYMTETSCLNDATELNHLVDLVVQRVQKEVVDYMAPTYAVDAMIIESMVDALYKIAEAEVDHAVTCFSSVRDDLTQWRAYASGENGFAIGFSAEALQTEDRCAFIKITYSTPKLKRILNKLVIDSLKIFRNFFGKPTTLETSSFITEFSEVWADHIGNFMPLVKHEAFQAEKEFRLISKITSLNDQECIVLARHSFISRHYPLNFSNDGKSLPKLPIQEIMVGPSRFQSVSHKSMEKLLKSRGFSGVTVSLSKIPFQTT